MPDNTFRLPSMRQRIAVIGRTGTGKTVAALWHLSNANFQTHPWTIIDFKTDENINAIERAIYIDIADRPPKTPGIYIAQPHPKDPALAAYMEHVWKKENHGIYIDEGYMMKENPDTDERFVTLLTQGRSKHIPMIVLSQRPAWVSRFVFSESDFFQVFHLNDKRDHKTIEAFLPAGSFRSLPDYHSLYFDVGKNRVTYLRPVPSETEILAKIDARLSPVRKRL
jgi:hypothetical protein